MACCAASGHRKPRRRIALPRDPRVKLSQQRTFLAWVRTAVSLLALGLVPAKFSLFLARLDPALSLAATNHLSLVLVVAGGLIDLLAGLAFIRQRNILMMALAAVVAGASAYAALYVVPH